MSAAPRSGKVAAELATWVAAFGFLLVPQAPAGAETLRVTIAAASYAPREVVARVGDVIEWSNEDIVLHSATDRAKNFDLNILPKHSGRLTLKNPGQLSYYCRYHPNMTGQITVNP
jgi:plastocyanin